MQQPYMLEQQPIQYVYGPPMQYQYMYGQQQQPQMIAIINP